MRRILAAIGGKVMALELAVVACLSDNFAYLVRDRASGECALIDAPEAEPVLATLAARGWRLGQILITHHHDDHVQALDAIRAATGARVIGAEDDRHRLPKLDLAVHPGDRFPVGGADCAVIAVPGHTLGHVAFHFPGAALAFTGDSLMAAGCGRIFEGTPAMMWDSLQRLSALPDETRIASGHDYLDANLRFAATIEPDNPAIARRRETVTQMRRRGELPMPWTLAEEKATNPFLRAGLPGVKAALGMRDAADVAVFAEIRARKDRF